ncbi:MAG: DUF962 domain-containing protein [Phycisphaerales bacterium]|jgi:uncharacterized membrane protein YGL010W|nr:DUF962 domain-containing protein [Phycisphaerales bacterium]
MKNWLDNWMLRHQNRTSLALHIVGIPACFVAAPALLVMHMWYWAAGAFVGGYILQFVGHAIEGNRSGEEMLLRRIMGKTTDPDEPTNP